MDPARTLRPGHRFASSIQPVAARAVRTNAAATTHTGHVRKANEDQFLIANVTSAVHVIRASFPQSHVYFGPCPSTLFIVADGMGGHAAGEHASALAVNTVESCLLRSLGRPGGEGTLGPRELLYACFRAADEAVFSASESHSSLKGMGTTLTVVLACGADVHVAHAGDSRAYHLRQGHLERLTCDHTVAGELEESGRITKDQAATHPLRHIITNVVGGGSAGVDPTILQMKALAADRILLCSDGLSDMVRDDRISEIMNTFASEPQATCDALVAAALGAGGHDNVTALVVAFC